MRRVFRIVLKGKQWRQGEQVRKSPRAEVCLVHAEKGEEAGVAERDPQGRRSEKGRQVRERQRSMQGL